MIQTLGIVSGIFLIGGYIPYIYEILTRTTVPSIASWFAWSLSTFIGLLSLGSVGTHEAIWVPIADAVGCGTIFLLSFYYGSKGWNTIDKVSVAVSIASIFVWYFTGSALLALIINIIVYVNGYVPTIKKIFVRAHSESLTAWTLFFIGVTLNVLIVIIGEDHGTETVLYATTLFITVGLLVGLLFWREKIQEKN